MLVMLSRVMWLAHSLRGCWVRLTIGWLPHGNVHCPGACAVNKKYHCRPINNQPCCSWLISLGLEAIFQIRSGTFCLDKFYLICTIHVRLFCQGTKRRQAQGRSYLSRLHTCSSEPCWQIEVMCLAKEGLTFWLLASLLDKKSSAQPDKPVNFWIKPLMRPKLWGHSWKDILCFSEFFLSCCQFHDEKIQRQRTHTLQVVWRMARLSVAVFRLFTFRNVFNAFTISAMETSSLFFLWYLSNHFFTSL